MDIKKVLFADDEPHIRKIGQLSLSKVGRWTVVLANSGQEAIEAAVRESPDVILLDVMMPYMDGPTALAELRERPQTAHIPVIFITAKTQKREIARYFAGGASGVILKPFDPMTLPAQIIEILRSGPDRSQLPDAADDPTGA